MRRIPVLAAAGIAWIGAALAPAAHAGTGTPRPEFEPVPVAPTEDAWIDVAPPRDGDWLARPWATPVAAPCGGARTCEAPCAPPPCAPDPCRWRFSFTIPLWVPSISGTFASGDTKVDTGGWLSGSHGLTDALDRFVSDTSTSLEFFFMGRLEARRGPWTLEADGYYASLTDTVDWKVRDEDASGTLDAAIVRVYGAWQERSPLGSCPTSPVLAVGPLVGARWYSISLSVDPATGPNLHSDKSWIDPIVGVKADVCFRNGASIDLVADVGGVVGGSTPSWSLDVELSWPLGRHWAVLLGWTVIDVDYDVGTGGGRFGMNVNLSGPHLGVTYRF